MHCSETLTGALLVSASVAGAIVVVFASHAVVTFRTFRATAVHIGFIMVFLTILAVWA